MNKVKCGVARCSESLEYALSQHDIIVTSSGGDKK